jgi:hypothetical protein
MSRMLPILLVALTAFGSISCASRRDTGQALIATGAVVAIVTSQASAGRIGCVHTGCAMQTSRRSAQAAAGVAAGVALAAVGAALASEPSTDSASRPRSRPSPQSGNWRLVRKPDPNEREEGPAYYIED